MCTQCFLFVREVVWLHGRAIKMCALFETCRNGSVCVPPQLAFARRFLTYLQQLLLARGASPQSWTHRHSGIEGETDPGTSRTEGEGAANCRPLRLQRRNEYLGSHRPIRQPDGGASSRQQRACYGVVPSVLPHHGLLGVFGLEVGVPTTGTDSDYMSNGSTMCKTLE